MLVIRNDSPTIAKERNRQREIEAARDRYLTLYHSKLDYWDRRLQAARDEMLELRKPIHRESPDPEPIDARGSWSVDPTCHIDLPETDDWLFDEGMPENVTDAMWFLMTRRNNLGRSRG